MQYVFLIYADPSQEDTPDLLARYHEFTQDVMSQGRMRAAQQLQRSHAATTVSVRQGRTVTTDGPYAETKEQIGGYYVLECSDLDEAIELAVRIPNAEDGYIEIRPVVGS